MSNQRKRKLPDGAFRLANDSCRPKFEAGGKECILASEAYYALLKAFCPKVGSDYGFEFTENAIRDMGNPVPRTGTFYPHGGATFHVATKNQQDALSDLFVKFQQALNDAEKRGRENGKNILLGLAGGTITNHEINHASIEGE